VVDGGGVAVSGVPMVCQRKKQTARLVVELFIAAAILFGLKAPTQ
jgi:hypothetical protein